MVWIDPFEVKHNDLKNENKTHLGGKRFTSSNAGGNAASTVASVMLEAFDTVLVGQH